MLILIPALISRVVNSRLVNCEPWMPFCLSSGDARGVDFLLALHDEGQACEIACNVGSDSIWLQISFDLALFSRRNQRNAAQSPPVQPRTVLLCRRPV
jgi:hypothetical protein